MRVLWSWADVGSVRLLGGSFVLTFLVLFSTCFFLYLS